MNDERQSPWVESVLINLATILGAVGAFIGTLDWFGLSGSLFLSGLFFLFFAFARAVPPIVHAMFPVLFAQITRIFLISRPAIFPFVIGSLLVLTSLILWLFDMASFRYLRSDFTLRHHYIEIDTVDFVEQFHISVQSNEVASQRDETRINHDQWLRWMATGGKRTINAIDADGRPTPPKYRHFMFVRSKAFDRNYGRMNAIIKIDARFTVTEVAAFLLNEDIRQLSRKSSGGHWYLPSWRTLHVSKEGQGAIHEVDITVDNPNRGECLVIFLQLENEVGDEPPTRDTLIPSGEIGVK